MVNYLWPSLTALLSVLITRQKFSLLIIPGILISLTGICLVLAGDRTLSLAEIANNVASEPLSYGLALAGALIWAVYCVLTQK